MHNYVSERVCEIDAQQHREQQKLLEKVCYFRIYIL